jgi:DNA ligase-1
MLGKFKVEFQGQIISVAPGTFSHEERRWIWDNRDQVRGKILKFRHFPHGVKELPRQPRALGFRDKMDM